MKIDRHSIKPSFGFGWDVTRILPGQVRWRLWFGRWIWHINVVKPHSEDGR